jgi:hypothetical protein
MAEKKSTQLRREAIEDQAVNGDPQDLKTKMARVLAEPKLRVFEYEGREYNVSSSALDDVEILELLEDEKYISVVRRILGKEQWETFKDSVREADGRVPSASLEGFLKVVMKVADPQDAS